MEELKNIPIQLIYACIAMLGGMARYLNGFVDGKKFSIYVFFASAFVSGFSGYMFALLGESLNMPYPIPHILAGIGGFFGDQTMKFLYEHFTRNIK